MYNDDKVKMMIKVAKEIGVEVDRYGNIKWNTSDGEEYRYKIKKNVVRRESYIPEIKEWVRINSHNIKSLEISTWELSMRVIKKRQEKNNV